MCIEKISWVGILGLTVFLASAAASAAPRSPSEAEPAPNLALNQEANGADLPQPPASTAPSSEDALKGAHPSLFYLSASVSSGLSSLATSNAGSNGTQTEFMMLGSLVLPNWIFEAGGGWCVSSLSGQASGTSAASGADLSLLASSISTTSGVAEVSPQYRLTEHLQIGPLAEMLFGTDVSFGSIGSASGPQNTTFLGGAQALYEFRLGASSLRLGARYLASLDLPGELMQSVQATLQFGLVVF